MSVLLAQYQLKTILSIAGYSKAGSSIINCHNSANITTTGSSVGGIVGACYGDITDSWNSGTIVSTGGYYAGGIAGLFNYQSTADDPEISDNAVISGCYNTGNISLEGTSGSYVGGIAGLSIYNTVINNCYNTGNISGLKNYIGGIAGENTQYATLINCYNSGNVSSTYENTHIIAGIAGENFHNAVVVNCYNSGTITTTYDRSGCHTAGIVADLKFLANVENCYNVGDISAGSTAIVGSTIADPNSTYYASGGYAGGLYSNLYYLEGTVPKGADSEIGTSMSDDEMKMQDFVDTLNANVATYNSASPDIEAVEWILGDDGYPILSWQAAE